MDAESEYEGNLFSETIATASVCSTMDHDDEGDDAVNGFPFMACQLPRSMEVCLFELRAIVLCFYAFILT